MSYPRLVLLGLLAGLAFSAVASAPASAACGATPFTHFVFCTDGGKEIGSPVAEVLGTSGVGLFEGKIGGASVKAECKSGFLQHSLLELLGKSKGVGFGKECKVLNPAECKIDENLGGQATGELIGKLEKPGKPEVEFTGAGAGEEFLTVAVTGCSLAGEYKITGKQRCELPKAEEFLVEHEVVCKKSGSKLKLGVETASVSGTAKGKLMGALEGLASAALAGT
jgi:hypothetical protein